MEKLNDYFCIKAFGGIEIRANGQVAMCCDMANNHVPVDAKLLNLNTNSLEDIVHNTGWKQIRQNMLDNKPSKACEQCYVNEKIGIKSQRQNSNNRFLSEAFFHAYNSDSDSHRLIDIDMKIGNVCNQMCVICDSASSSMLYNEDIEIFGRGSVFPVKWWRDTSVWDQLVEQFRNVKLINIYGGEPLLIKEVKLPLKTKRFVVVKSPHFNKKSKEHFQIKTHSRLIDLLDPTHETTVALKDLDLPAGVDIAVKV